MCRSIQRSYFQRMVVAAAAAADDEQYIRTVVGDLNSKYNFHCYHCPAVDGH